MKTIIVLDGNPVTKKNSGRVIRCGSFTKIIPSKQFADYEQGCLWQLANAKILAEPINFPVNVKMLWYMKTDYSKAKARIDRTNLESGTLDILVDAHVLEDDNSRIVVSTDGSRVLYDKDRPRVEITITETVSDEETIKKQVPEKPITARDGLLCPDCKQYLTFD